jgi:hypothetical protein
MDRTRAKVARLQHTQQSAFTEKLRLFSRCCVIIGILISVTP